jgi:hypothetical protein
MKPIDVEKFIRDNDLVDVGTFAVVKIKNNEDWTKKYFCNIVKIDSQMSGFYENEFIKKDVELPVGLWDLFHVAECIVFDCGDLIMCLEESWDGWQSSMILSDYYKTDYMKDIF